MTTLLTNAQLHAIMPQLADAKNVEFFPFLVAAMTEFSIDAPARMAAFLAQLAHESAQLRFMEEIWGPTAAQQRYEPRSKLATDLGNTEPGDGRRFKGRGPIQITGRANYRRFGDLLGVDLIADPARAALPDVAFRMAALFWSKKGLNELADDATVEAFREITKRINGGLNGLADRQQFHSVARTVLGISHAPAVLGGPPRRTVREPEPLFARGNEAIRADARRRRTRKRAAAERGRRSTTVRRRRKRRAKG